MVDGLQDLMHKIFLESEEIIAREVFVDKETLKWSRFKDDFCLLGKLLF